jgi:hypothetical protein
MPASPPSPTVVAIEMGYGHLRPAHALAEVLGAQVLEADRPPLADEDERKLWARTRGSYETASRLSQLGLVGAPLRALVEALTEIQPLHPHRDLSAPTAPVRLIERMRQRGLGAGLVAHLRRTGSPLLTTFFVPAVIADHERLPVGCVVTDSDINRVWAPYTPQTTQIRYFAPSQRVLRRLRAYGVPRANIHMTGYPLPDELLGGRELTVLKRNLAARLARLDPRGRFVSTCRAEIERALGELPVAGAPPKLTFAVGGAGAQAELAEEALPRLRVPLLEGKLRLALVAGVRPEIAARFERALERAELGGELGRSVEILHAENMPSYFRRFNALLADTDILWSKPSEITFFAALGLPLVFAPPVGVHERYNRRWALEHGAGLIQRNPRHAGEWLQDWLDDGTLAGAAWSAFVRLPTRGLYNIVDLVNQSPELARPALDRSLVN